MDFPQDDLYNTAGEFSMDYRNVMQDPDLKVTVAPYPSHGVASRDPGVICRDLPELENASLDRFTAHLTYDTFQALGFGRPETSYTFTWRNPVELNFLQLTMGFPFADGGWWTSLFLEYRGPGDESWKPLPAEEFSPPYNTMDTPFGRFPFEEYRIQFRKTRLVSLRLRGTGGGYSSFTSLANVRAGLKDPDVRERAKTRNYPMPGLFSLISAGR